MGTLPFGLERVKFVGAPRVSKNGAVIVDVELVTVGGPVRIRECRILPDRMTGKLSAKMPRINMGDGQWQPAISLPASWHTYVTEQARLAFASEFER